MSMSTTLPRSPAGESGVELSHSRAGPNEGRSASIGSGTEDVIVGFTRVLQSAAGLMGAMPSSAPPDGRTMEATTQAIAITGTIDRAVFFMGRLFLSHREAREVSHRHREGMRRSHGNLLPQGLERRTQLRREQLRLLPRREVTALVDLVEVDQVLVGTPGPCLRRSIDVLREDRDGYRQRDLGGL